MSSSEHEQIAEVPTEASTLPLWRNRDYLLLWSGQIVSITGSEVSQLAFPLLILALTHSPAQAGIAAALRAIPYLILSLPAGALVDRWNRKQVMIFCNLGRFLCLASIPGALVLGHLTIIQLYLVSLLEGILFVLFDLAEVSSLPQVISKEQFPAATAQGIATDYTSQLLGSLLGGFLYSMGRPFPFLADAISYLCSVLSLLFIQTSAKRLVSSKTVSTNVTVPTLPKRREMLPTANPRIYMLTRTTK
jgi:MFS family permease